MLYRHLSRYRRRWSRITAFAWLCKHNKRRRAPMHTKCYKPERRKARYATLSQKWVSGWLYMENAETVTRLARRWTISSAHDWRYSWGFSATGLLEGGSCKHQQHSWIGGKDFEGWRCPKMSCLVASSLGRFRSQCSIASGSSLQRGTVGLQRGRRDWRRRVRRTTHV